jgi:hypothetical protein
MNDLVQIEMIEYYKSLVVVQNDNNENEFCLLVNIPKNNHNEYFYSIQLQIIFLFEIDYQKDIMKDESYHYKE